MIIIELINIIWAFAVATSIIYLYEKREMSIMAGIVIVAFIVCCCGKENGPILKVNKRMQRANN